MTVDPRESAGDSGRTAASQFTSSLSALLGIGDSDQAKAVRATQRAAELEQAKRTEQQIRAIVRDEITRFMSGSGSPREDVANRNLYAVWERLAPVLVRDDNPLVLAAVNQLLNLGSKSPVVRLELADDHHEALDGEMDEVRVVVRLAFNRIVDDPDKLLGGVSGADLGQRGAEFPHASPSLIVDDTESVGDGPRAGVEPTAPDAGHPDDESGGSR